MKFFKLAYNQYDNTTYLQKMPLVPINMIALCSLHFTQTEGGIAVQAITSISEQIIKI